MNGHCILFSATAVQWWAYYKRIRQTVWVMRYTSIYRVLYMFVYWLYISCILSNHIRIKRTSVICSVLQMLSCDIFIKSSANFTFFVAVSLIYWPHLCRGGHAFVHVCLSDWKQNYLKSVVLIFVIFWELGFGTRGKSIDYNFWAISTGDLCSRGISWQHQW